MTIIAQDLGGVVLDGVRFEIVKVACRDEPGACGLRIHIDHQSFDIGRGFDDSEHAEWMAKQFSSALNRLVARTHSAEIAGALLDAERYRWLRAEHAVRSPIAHVCWKRNGDRECGDWVNTSGPDQLDTAIDSAMQQGGGGGESTPPSDA